MQQLNLPNVFMYLDAGHAGWSAITFQIAKADAEILSRLGWPGNLQPAAQLQLHPTRQVRNA